MFTALGNNFGAGEIRFKSYQQPNFAILNTRFMMDPTSPEYQAADVLEIQVPALSIDRSTDSVAMIAVYDRSQSYGRGECNDTIAATKTWIKDSHTICIEKLAHMEGKGEMCVYIYTAYIQLNQGITAERHNVLPLSVTPSPNCCPFSDKSFIIVKQNWVFLFIGRDNTHYGTEADRWEGIVANLPTDVQAIVPFYGGNPQYDPDYTLRSEAILKGGRYIHPYRAGFNYGKGTFGFFVRGDNAGEVIPDIPMAPDSRRCKLVLKSPETVVCFLSVDLVIEGGPAPINVCVVGTFTSAGASDADSYYLSEPSKTVPGGTAGLVSRSNAGNKLAIYDLLTDSILNDASMYISSQCSAPMNEEMEVFDTSVYTYRGTV